MAPQRGPLSFFNSLLATALFLTLASVAAGQSTKMPSTLRYGSGLMDIPVASVLPHMVLTGTYSGFWSNNDTDFTTDPNGAITGTTPFDGGWSGDLALALGLYDIFELGASIQSLAGTEKGGTLWGAFGRVSLLNPQVHGLGLAVGGRYLNSPDFGDGVGYAPTRLGRADRRLRDRLGGQKIDTEFSFYAVAGADLAGFSSGFLPEHDFTLSAGWGTGLFTEGDHLEWHEFGDTEGWFAGAAWHVQLASSKILTLMTEYNGFDWNVGTQVDLNGIRLGAHVLGVNYANNISVYRSNKFGLLGSVSLCGRGLCKASLRKRSVADTIVLPAPPPDTVVVTRVEAPPLPVGTPAEICLATGRSVEVLLTAAGDTLVGPSRASLRELRPTVALAGTYAEGRAWYEADESISYEKRSYDKAGGLVRLGCSAIKQVAEYLGVPLFVMRNVETPYEIVYAPVRPGVWQAYQAGLQRTRGQ